METHQALQVTEFQVDFFGVAVLFVLFAETGAVVEEGLVALLVDDTAHFDESLHVVFFQVEVNGLLVVLAGDQQLT